MTSFFSNLPTWIYVLLATLLWLGYTQTKTRHISRLRITVLPIIFLGLSLYSVMHVPHALVAALVAWGIGIRLAFRLNDRINYGKGVSMDADREHYVVPGSWLPLMLMMSVFVVRFIQGYLVGSHTIDPDSFYTITVSALVSGTISGTFLARAVQIFKAVKASLTTPTLTTIGA